MIEMPRHVSTLTSPGKSVNRSEEPPYSLSSSVCLHTCSVRSTFPGRHFGAALGFPYLTRSLSKSIRVASAPIFLVIIFTSTSIAFYPYAKDFAKLCKLIYNAVQRRHYLYNRSMISTFVALYFYFSTIFIELLDVSFGIYCPQTIMGLPIVFPNFNFPLFLFLLHTAILQHHKAMPAIIYEVNNEDCFIQLNRLRCITNKDCPQMSTAFPLDALPSRTTTIQRRAFDGRIIQIRAYRELDDILPCKVSTQVRKVSTFSSRPPMINQRSLPSTILELE
ncbi:unnamed protein product [Caenorhabditis sp. 36 PRJEB53466]|nr:unnamed protein product [Caenorhabditis sp. 36 PRJEB53466]